MAKWSFSNSTWTPTAVADGSAMVTGGNPYMALKGGSTTQRLDISEIFMGGQAPSASSPCIMVLARDSAIATGTLSLASGAKNAALDPATADLAAPQVPFTSATTAGPTRSATLGLLNLSFNAYGGIVRWFAPDQNSVLKLLGNTASFGEISLSAFTGGTPGLMGSHIIYEPW